MEMDGFIGAERWLNNLLFIFKDRDLLIPENTIIRPISLPEF